MNWVNGKAMGVDHNTLCIRITNLVADIIGTQERNLEDEHFDGAIHYSNKIAVRLALSDPQRLVYMIQFACDEQDCTGHVAVYAGLRWVGETPSTDEIWNILRYSVAGELIQWVSAVAIARAVEAIRGFE